MSNVNNWNWCTERKDGIFCAQTKRHFLIKVTALSDIFLVQTGSFGEVGKGNPWNKIVKMAGEESTSENYMFLNGALFVTLERDKLGTARGSVMILDHSIRSE